jgi:putative membrane protein
MHGFQGMNWGMNWGTGLSWIFGIALLILLVWAIVKITSNRTPASAERQKTALEILKERFAKGEINKEEYEKKGGSC